MVISVDAIQARLPSTKDLATGAAPPDGTFPPNGIGVTGKGLAFDETDMMVVLMNAGDIQLIAVNPQPLPLAPLALRWHIDRNPDDTIARDIPLMGTTRGGIVTDCPRTRKPSV
jgi:hypothetical protein